MVKVGQRNPGLIALCLGHDDEWKQFFGLVRAQRVVCLRCRYFLMTFKHAFIGKDLHRRDRLMSKANRHHHQMLVNTHNSGTRWSYFGKKHQRY